MDPDVIHYPRILPSCLFDFYFSRWLQILRHFAVDTRCLVISHRIITYSATVFVYTNTSRIDKYKYCVMVRYTFSFDLGSTLNQTYNHLTNKILITYEMFSQTDPRMRYQWRSTIPDFEGHVSSIK